MHRFHFAALAAIAVFGVATVASAADLPVKAPAYRARSRSLQNWTGFYVGGNVGYSWGDWDATSNQAVYDFEFKTDSPKVDGWLGGLQAGYNWQNGQWVYGIETDFQWTGEKRQHNWSDPGSTCTNDEDFIPPNCDAGPAYVASEWKLRWFGTLRGRVGFLVAPTWLAYITGGLAYGNAEYNFAFSQPGASISYSLTNSVTNVGWTLGGGLETKIADRWTMKVEYLYIDLGEQTINTVDNDGNPFSVQNKLRDNILRVGLNYKLN